jgi:hypothetical protein
MQVTCRIHFLHRFYIVKNMSKSPDRSIITGKEM